MKRMVLSKKFIAAMLLGTTFLAGCGDDDDFAPVSRNRGYDYLLTSTKEFADYPCNEMREGREAVVGRDKESYYCQFDYRDSVYIWAGYDDTLTATGKEFVRSDASSSSRGSSSSDDDDYSSSSSSYRSSSSYSSSYSSSSYRSSSSYTWVDPFNPDTDYGSMTDPRDGKTYKTVVVNGQTWMAENLNYAGNNVGTAVCYDDDDFLCEQYGRLYSRDAAMDDSRCEYLSNCDLGSDPIQGICPDGWHIPTVEEMNDLVDFVGTYASRYKSKESNWRYDDGTDTYGLSFLGAGNWDSKDGFEDIYKYEVTWAYYPDTYQHYLLVGGSDGTVSIISYKNTEYYSSVRCISDEAPVYYSSSARSSSSYSSSSSSSSWYDHNLSSSATRKKTYEYCDDYSVNWPDTKDDIFNPNIEYGTMTDPRDGKTYRTVEVLGQIWMAENLNFADSANFPLLKGNTFCYEDDEEKCNILGRLYKRQAAMNTESCYNDADSFCNTGDEPVQGICPDGWHLPSAEDVWELIDLEKGDARAFMSAYGWISGEEAVLPGENTYGLSFVGNYFQTLSKCATMSGLGMYAIMWVSNYGFYHHYMVIQGQENHIILMEYETGSLERGVRCIKDE